MTGDDDHRSNGKYRRRGAESRYRRRLSWEHKPIEMESHITNACHKTNIDRRKFQEAVDPRGFSTESPSWRELTNCERRQTDHDNAGESKTLYSSVPSNSRTPKHPSDFRAQQPSSRSNKELSRSKKDDPRSYASLLRLVWHSKHQKNILIKESLRSTQDSVQQHKRKHNDTKLDQDAKVLPSNAIGDVDKISKSDTPECSLSKDKSLSNIAEEATNYKRNLYLENKTTFPDKITSIKKTGTSGKQKGLPLENKSSGIELMFMPKSYLYSEKKHFSIGTAPADKIMEANQSDDTTLDSSLTTGTLNTPVQTNDFEFSDNAFCNSKQLDLSSDPIISRPCPEAEINDDTLNKNVVVATSKEHTQASHQVDPKPFLKQYTDRHTNAQSTPRINVNCKAAVKRKLIPNEDNTLPGKVKKTQNTLANVNMPIGDIQVSNNNKRFIYDESTEDEQIAEDNVKKRRVIRRRNKRHMISKRNTYVLNINKMTKAIKNMQRIFRSLFGESVTKSESEEERILLKSKYIVQDKSINSCSTEMRDSSNDNDDDTFVCKSNVYTLVDDSQKDIKDENLVKMQCNPVMVPDTENIISKNCMSMEFSVAKADTREATKLAKINMKEYISKKEIRELLRTLQRNLNKTILSIFEKVAQNDMWTSKIKQILVEIQKYNCEKNSLAADKYVNMYKDLNSSVVLLNTSLTKLISGAKDQEKDDSCDAVNLTLMKDDVFTENTSTMKIDCELTPKKSPHENETHIVSKDFRVESVSANQSTNIDSILSSKDDASNASTMIVNQDWTSPKESTCGDDAHTVNENSCMEMSVNQSSTSTSDNQSSTDNTADINNEVELEIKIKSKSGSTNDMFSLKIPSSLRAKYIDNFKENLRRMTVGISSEMTTNGNRTEENDTSEEALDTNQFVTTKNIEAMSSIQQVSNNVIQNSINPEEKNSKSDLSSNIDKENTTERDEGRNDQCVQSVERESTQTASISIENSVESSIPVYDVSDSEESLLRNSLSESKKNNEQILKKSITDKTQYGRNSPIYLNLTVRGTSGITSTNTTVASSRVFQASLPTSTSSVTNVFASSPAISATSTHISVGNLSNLMIMNEIEILNNIGYLIQRGRYFLHRNNIKDLPQMILIITKLFEETVNLRTLLLRGNMPLPQTNFVFQYAVHRLNCSILQNSPTSLNEIRNMEYFVVKNMAKHNNHLSSTVNSTVPSTSAQKSPQNVQCKSVVGQGIPHIKMPVTRNTVLRMAGSNQATETSVSEQRYEANMNNAASTLQQKQSIVNSSQHSKFQSNIHDILQTPQRNPTTANTSLLRLMDSSHADMPRMLQTTSSSANVNQQQLADNEHIPHTQQLSAATENIEQQLLLDSTNNIPLMPQSNSITANMEQFLTNTSNILHVQQPNQRAENIDQRQLSANTDHISQSSSVTANIEQQQSSNNINNILFMLQSSPVVTNMERQRFSTNTSNILHVQQPNQRAENIDQRQLSDNMNKIPVLQQLSIAMANIERQQSLVSTNNIPHMTQSTLRTTNMGQPKCLIGTSNILHIQQPNPLENIKQLSAKLDNTLHMTQSSTAMANIERQQSLVSTNNIPHMTQSTLRTTNMGQPKCLIGTSNILHIQQPNPLENIKQLSAKLDNTLHMTQLSTAMANVGRQQSSGSTNNILPQSIPITVNMGQQFSAGTSNIPRVQQPSLMTGNLEQQQSNIKNIQNAMNVNLNNIAHVSKLVPLSGSTTMNIRQQQLPRNTPYTSHVLNPEQLSAMKMYQQFARFKRLRNVNNVLRMPQSAMSMLNVNQMSQTTNVAAHNAREPLRDMSYVNNQQQICPRCPVYRNFYMLPQNQRNFTSLPPLKYVNSHSANTAASNSIGQGRSHEASQGTNRKEKALPNEQLQQANVQQQLSGSAFILIPNSLPNYTNVMPTAANSSEMIKNIQTQNLQSYQMSSAQHTMPRQRPFISKDQIQSQHRLSKLPQISASKATYQHINVNQQSYVIMYDTTTGCSNDAPVASITVQQNTVCETPPKTKSLQQMKYVLVANTDSMPATSSKLCSRPATSSHLELVCQKVTENLSVSSEKNIPQSFAIDTGALVASLGPDVSQKKTTSVSSLSHTSMSSTETSEQAAQNASAKHADNSSTETSASQKNPMTKLSSQKRKVKTLTTGDISNLRVFLPASNISEDLSNSSSYSLFNSKLPKTTQSAKSEQKLSQSTAKATNEYNFNLDVFTDIQKLIIQDQLKTYFQVSFKTIWHVLTKQQLKMWETDRNLLHCFHDFLWKYLNKFEKKDTKMVEKNEAWSLSSYQKQKRSTRPNETTKLRRNEKLEEIIQYLKNDTKLNASTIKSTPEDLSMKTQNKESLSTSNSPKSATTETLSSGFVKPQRDEYMSTMCSKLRPFEKLNIPRENPDVLHENSIMETPDTVKPDGAAKSTEQEFQLQESPDEQSLESSSPDLVIDIQSLSSECEEEFGSDAQQEQSDEILFEGEHKADTREDDVKEHEPKKLKNPSQDIINVNSMHLCQSSSDAETQDSEEINEQLVPKREFEKLKNLSQDILNVSSIDLCQSSSEREEEDSEEINEQLMPKREFEKFENLSQGTINVSPIDLCQNSPDTEIQNFEITNVQSMLKKEAQVEEVFPNFETPERAWYIEESDQLMDTSIRWKYKEEGTTLSAHSEPGTSNKQFGYSLKPEDNEEAQVCVVKNEEMNNIATYDDIFKSTLFREHVTAYDSTKIEDVHTANELNIFNICSISPMLYEKLGSDTFLAPDDQPQLVDEKENEKLSNSNNNSEIIKEEDIPCLRCKRKSTVCCGKCMTAYYCSKRCSDLYWNSNHHMHCKPYDRST